MLKETDLIVKVKQRVEEILNDTNIFEIIGIEQEYSIPGKLKKSFKIDLKIDVKTKSGKTFSIMIEVKSPGLPGYIRMAVSQLKEFISEQKNVYGVIGAPFLSEESKKICRDAGFGFIDAAGNCFLRFNNTHIQIEGKPNPYPATRPLKTLFSTKSTRMIRVLLCQPKTTWYVKDLAAEAKLSLGQVSNLKKRLLEYEWIEETDDGKFRLVNPEGLLNNWAKNYNYQMNEIRSFYVMQEPDDIEYVLTNYLDKNDIRYAFTLNSGANRVAPFLRYQKVFCYIDNNVDQIVYDLGLKEVPSGANVILMKPYDVGIFYGTQQIDGATIVSDVQLYLDLKSSKERTEEAAEFILNERIRKKW
ncbi:MAG: type IV toxin-antitoxin system AbiEi family antitoxin [bacterium]|nr:type IV toxin-antitoxin system AbiEi family antitoxin [bacterium]